MLLIECYELCTYICYWQKWWWCISLTIREVWGIASCSWGAMTDLHRCCKQQGRSFCCTLYGTQSSATVQPLPYRVTLVHLGVVSLHRWIPGSAVVKWLDLPGSIICSSTFNTMQLASHSMHPAYTRSTKWLKTHVTTTFIFKIRDNSSRL